MNERVREVLAMIDADCETDVIEVDRTPFTPRGVGGLFGDRIATDQALAKSLLATLDEVSRIAEALKTLQDEQAELRDSLLTASREAIEDHNRLEILWTMRPIHSVKA